MSDFLNAETFRMTLGFRFQELFFAMLGRRVLQSGIGKPWLGKLFEFREEFAMALYFEWQCLPTQ